MGSVSSACNVVAVQSYVLRMLQCERSRQKAWRMLQELDHLPSEMRTGIPAGRRKTVKFSPCKKCHGTITVLSTSAACRAAECKGLKVLLDV